MSNPYGGTPYGNPDDQNPYGGGQGGQPPYGAPYGGQPPYGGPPPAKTDGISIAALILSFLCCLAPIGVILGFVGLSRTKNGQRKGRGMAIAAIIIGILMTLVVIALVVTGVVFGKSVVTIDEAKVGLCVNVSEDGNDLLFTEKDCNDDHDGEIVYVGTYDEVENSDFMPTNPDDVTDSGVSYGICSGLMDPEDVAKIPDDAEWGFALEDPTSAESDDPFFCYVTAEGLDSSLL